VCGFVGYVGAPGTLSPGGLARATEILSHRGPDGAGSWTCRDGAVMLGHRRLAVVDLSSAAAQPMQSASGTLCIVYNGEIYNHPEVREELRAQGHAFRTRSDTEVLLAAYEAWGADGLARLNGMFSFALWDEEKRTLFAARDRFGEKPLYYYVGSDFLLFASEIKALFATGLVSPKANERAIYRYLAFREIDAGEETPFAGIRALPPAHCLTYVPATGSLSISRYWALDPDDRTSLPDDEAYAERFRELLSDSVRIRLRSDVPVGSSLSGGLDSSSVVCLMARELTGGTQKTFSARFDDARYDEGPYIERVNLWAGTVGSEVFPNPSSLPSEMNRLVWHQEEPFFSTSIYAQWCVMRLAKVEGVTVLLDGQGGDETLAGYQTYYGPHFRDLLRRLRWASFVAEGSAYVRKHGSRGLPLLLFTMLPSRLRQPIRRRARPQALHPDFAREWRREEERTEEHFRRGLDDAQYQTLTRTMLPVLLRYADRNSMAFSREVRLPFLDHRLVEFLLSIPAEQRLRGTTTKFILREALRDILPEEIRTRKDKLGYAPPQGDWLRGPLKDWVDDLLQSRSFAQRGWVDAPRARQAWAGFLAGRGAAESQVWRWAALEAWARVFLDGEASSA
jgi:asparagine synthase (glutamine-hydrolysing)